MILFPAALVAQSGSVSAQTQETLPLTGPGYSQLYCSGFITRDHISRSTFVLGSKESPHEGRFEQHSTLFLRGEGLTPGARFSVIRQVEDLNREDSSPDQRKRLASLGDHYDDIGWLTVQSIENGTAVATFDFSCEPAMPGDILVPFRERPQPTLRPTSVPLDSFRTGSPAVTGHILGSRDYLSVVGAGVTVFTDFGSNKGAKPGDYLIISRGYAPGDLNRIDRISENLPRDVQMSAQNPASVPSSGDALMPVHILGEMVILSVSPDASVALITRTAAEVQLGDVVQLEGAQVVASAAVADAGPVVPQKRVRRMFSFLHSKAETVR